MMSRSSKGRWVVLLTVMMVLGVAGNAAAHGTVDQSSESFDGKSCFTTHTVSLAQTFTPTANTLTGVDVYMFDTDPAFEVALTIRNANPNGALLATVANVPLSDEWNHIDLAVPIDLMPDKTYAIRLDRLDRIVGGPCWSVGHGNPYLRGRFWSNGGFVSDNDLDFRTYYVPDNEPPVADPNGPYSVAEGSAVTLNGSASSDPDAGDVLTFAWSPDTYLDDTSSATPEFTGVDDSVATLTLTVTDPSGATDSNTAEVTVTNVAPTVGAITGAPVGPIPVGTTVTLAAAFTDPGTADTHVATWSRGDGSGTVTSPASSSILYDTAGVYSETVTVTVTDDDGGSDTETLELVVVVAVVGDLEERKQAVRDDLAALSSTLDDKDAKKLEKALRHLDKSLTAKYWVDGDTLVARDGKKVFSEESKAVKDLEKIKNTDVSVAIASLVAIDKQLAQGAINDAQDRYDAVCSDPTTRECEKAAKELDKAAKELDKAQKELLKGHFAHAIGKYKKAWEKADKALKELLKLDLGGDA